MKTQAPKTDDAHDRFARAEAFSASRRTRGLDGVCYSNLDKRLRENTARRKLIESAS